MPRRKPRKPFKGVLGTPTPRYSDEVTTRVCVPKLIALMDHYDIPRGDHNKWFQLAMHLAIDLVPGFAPAQPQGRKSNVDNVVEDINLLIRLGAAEFLGESVKNAARLLVKEDKHKGKNPSTLRDRYYALKDPKSPAGRLAREALKVLVDSGHHRKVWGDRADGHVGLVAFILDGRDGLLRVWPAAKKVAD